MTDPALLAPHGTGDGVTVPGSNPLDGREMWFCVAVMTKESDVTAITGGIFARSRAEAEGWITRAALTQLPGHALRTVQAVEHARLTLKPGIAVQPEWIA